MKELLLIAGGALEDGTRIQRASDGDIIRNDNPAATHSVKMGGADQALNAFGVHIWDLFGKQAGNLEMMGGLAPQSKTLGQDQMLAQNASGGMMDMQQTTTEFVSETMKALCWYWWHDPVRHYDSPFELPGLDDHLNRTVTPKDRNQLPWEKLIVRLDPYSLQHQTPQQRLQAINAFVQQSYLPMAQMYQQAGIVLDLQKYAQMVAKYTDNPDLEDLITMQEPPAEAEGPSGSGESAPGKPPETTRNYVRRSIGADTAANRQAEVSNRTPGEEPAIQKVGME